MRKIMNGWYIVSGILFLLLAAANLVSGRLLEAVWCTALGLAGLFLYFLQRRPDLQRARWVWLLVVVWIAVVAALTLLRFQAVM